MSDQLREELGALCERWQSGPGLDFDRDRCSSEYAFSQWLAPRLEAGVNRLCDESNPILNGDSNITRRRIFLERFMDALNV